MDNKTNFTSSLSIRYSSDGFSLCINDSDNNIVLHKKSKHSNSASIIESFAAFVDHALELNTNANKTEVCFESELYTLSPSGLFSLSELLSIIEFQHNTLPETEYILQQNELKTQNSVIAFIIETAIYDVINSRLENCIIKHHLTDAIEDVLKQHSQLRCYVRKNKMDLILAINNKLICCNTYIYTTNEDILFHILNIKRTLNIETDSLQTIIWTNFDHQELEEVLRTHITKLDFKTT